MFEKAKRQLENKICDIHAKIERYHAIEQKIGGFVEELKNRLTEIVGPIAHPVTIEIVDGAEMFMDEAHVRDFVLYQMYRFGVDTGLFSDPIVLGIQFNDYLEDDIIYNFNKSDIVGKIIFGIQNRYFPEFDVWFVNSIDGI